MDWDSFKKKLKWLDPFTYSDLLLDRLGFEDGLVRFGVEVVTAFISAWIVYALLGLLLGSSMPLVVVVSGSMEPVLHRGDVVILQGATNNPVKVQEIEFSGNLTDRAFSEFGAIKPFLNQQGNVAVYGVEINRQLIVFDQNGETVVYYSRFSQVPVIHRAVLKIHANDGVFLLTKGDANPTFDQDCGRVVLGRPEYGCITPYPVLESEVVGKQLLKIPFIGYVKLLLWDDVLELVSGCPKGLAIGEYCGYLKAVR